MDEPTETAAPAPAATHDLLLSDGSSVAHSGAIPTHFDDAVKGLLRVIGVTERKRS